MNIRKVKAYKVITNKGEVYETTSLYQTRGAAVVKETFIHKEDK